MTDKEEIERVKQRIEKLLEKDRRLKFRLKRNGEDLSNAENYLASLLRKPVSEITSVKSITDHLEEILRRNERPMKAQELWEWIRDIPGLLGTGLPTVTTALIRNANKGKRFRKTAPNTYELLDKENM